MWSETSGAGFGTRVREIPRPLDGDGSCMCTLPRGTGISTTAEALRILFLSKHRVVLKARSHGHFSADRNTQSAQSPDPHLPNGCGKLCKLENHGKGGRKGEVPRKRFGALCSI